jgi:hypothetical protein
MYPSRSVTLPKASPDDACSCRGAVRLRLSATASTQQITLAPCKRSKRLLGTVARIKIQRRGRVVKGVTSLVAGVVRHNSRPQTSLVCMSDALHDHRGRRNNGRAHCRAASSGPQQRLPAARAGVNRRHERRTPEPGRGVAGHQAASRSHAARRPAERSPAAGAGHGSPHQGAHPPGPGDPGKPCCRAVSRTLPGGLHHVRGPHFAFTLRC